MLFYYKVDLAEWLSKVKKGKSPKPQPWQLLSLIEGLPDTSMSTAMATGGREHFGWGQDRYILAAQYDAINANTIATGQFKKGKAPKVQPWPRPSMSKKGRRKSGEKQTVAKLFKAMSTGANKF